MKKFLLLLTLVSATCAALASSYFTAGENGTLRINPNSIGFYYRLTIRAHFESRFDFWSVQLNQHPSGMTWNFYDIGSGMTIPYTKSDGNDTTYTAILSSANNFTVYSSSIPVFGYWDYNNDGIYEPYGTVKWGPADYDEMFIIDYRVNNDCTGDTLKLSGEMTSTMDWRGGTGNEMFQTEVYIKFGYMPGDVNGDERIDVSDTSLLIAYILGSVTFDQYQIEAADVNHDGDIDTADVTAVIAIINSN